MRRFAVLLCFALATTCAQAEEWIIKRKIAGSFADARDAVVMAIENRGLVVNYTSHIADRQKSSNSVRPACRER